MKTANTGKDRAHPSYVKILHDMQKRRKQLRFSQYKNLDHPAESLNSTSTTNKN